MEEKTVWFQNNERKIFSGSYPALMELERDFLMTRGSLLAREGRCVCACTYVCCLSGPGSVTQTIRRFWSLPCTDP